MRLLVTPKEAASRLYVTVGMIAYWIRKGRLTKHPTSGRNYLVDLDEAERASKWRENLMAEMPDNLVTPTQAAEMLFVCTREISYYAKKGYIKKHYVLGNKKHYLVDVNEVLAQPDRIAEMYSAEERKDRLRKKAAEQMRDPRGRNFISTNQK